MHTTRHYASFAALVRQHNFATNCAMDYIVLHPKSVSARRITEIIAFCRLLRPRFACESGLGKAHFL
jgi:hypothetical protein